MGSDETLAALRDIHLPAPVSDWPIAPGWWIVLSLLLATLAYLTYRAILKRKAPHPKQQALQALQALSDTYQVDPHLSQTCIQASLLLKYVALAYYPRERVAQLYGKAWIDFLNANAKKIDFGQFEDFLNRYPYQTAAKVPHAELLPFIECCQTWVKQQRKPQ